jgi:hypothetical protein
MSSANPGPEFTMQYPLIVKVGWIKNKWDIQPTTDTFPPDGKTYAAKMLERIRAVPNGGAEKLQENWGQRGIRDGQAKPKFLQDLEHIPIVVRPFEYVRFQCDYPFFITAGRDKNVFPDGDSPDSPFVWPASQQSSMQQGPYFVIGVSQRDIHQQRFFKCQAWLQKDGQTVWIDPDTVGTTDGGG